MNPRDATAFLPADRCMQHCIGHLVGPASSMATESSPLDMPSPSFAWPSIISQWRIVMLCRWHSMRTPVPPQSVAAHPEDNADPSSRTSIVMEQKRRMEDLRNVPQIQFRNQALKF